MKTGNKDKKTGIGGFLKYRENKLSGREKNDFEKELQRDPFALEAEEGLSEISPGQLKDDMHLLKRRISGRTGHSRSVVIYRIAAGVALLAAVSSIYLLLNRTPGSKELSSSEKIALAQPKNEEKPAGKVKDLILDNTLKSVKEKKVIILSPPSAPERKEISRPDLSKKEEKTLPVAMDSVQLINAELSVKTGQLENQVSSDKASVAAPVAMSRSMLDERKIREVRGRIISSDDGSPLPGTTVAVKGTTIGTVSDASGNFRLVLPDKNNLTVVASTVGMDSKEMAVARDSVMNFSLNPSTMALSEVVTVGYGVRKSAAEDKEGESTLPEPEGGMVKFQSFIKNNMRYPLEYKAADKQVVVLVFKVRTNGYPDSINVVRSPGKPFSDEAIRLLKEGPLWKPATIDGKAVENDARVRIVFK